MAAPLPSLLSRRATLPVLAALALAGIATFQIWAARNAQRDCTGGIETAWTPPGTPDWVFEVVVKEGWVGTPKSSLAGENTRTGKVGDFKIHAEAMVHASYGLVIGHRIRFIQDTKSCSGRELAPPWHEQFEPPYRLLFDRSREVFRLVSVSTPGPVFDFRRIPRLQPPPFVKLARVAAPAFLGLAAVSWAAGTWRRVRARAPAKPSALLGVALVLAAIAFLAAVLGWDTAYLARGIDLLAHTA